MMLQPLRALFAGTLSIAAGAVVAGGYKIPENSINSTALSAAYVANAHGADAAYHNPAAMVFNPDQDLLEASLTYIYLSETDYDGETTLNPSLGPPIPLGFSSDSSKHQHFFVPTFHYSSRPVGNARFGLSVVVPAGLTKRWSDPAPKTFAQKFDLKTVEINPSAAYRISDQFAAGFGLRAVYSDGTVRSDGPGGPLRLTRDLTGDSWDYGFNLALLYKPTDTVNLALTYRSNIDLSVSGDATLEAITPGPTDSYSGSASVEVPIPATLALAAAFDLNEKTTVEVVLERTYWSEYDELDFDYADDLTSRIPPLLASFDRPLDRDWNDSSTIRVGITHQYDDRWTLMGAYAYDETPVPENTLSFELPDSDAHIISFGARYQLSNETSIGAGLLYDYKTSRRVNNDDIDGEFKNASAILATFGVQVAL